MTRRANFLATAGTLTGMMLYLSGCSSPNPSSSAKPSAYVQACAAALVDPIRKVTDTAARTVNEYAQNGEDARRFLDGYFKYQAIEFCLDGERNGRPVEQTIKTAQERLVEIGKKYPRNYLISLLEITLNAYLADADAHQEAVKRIMPKDPRTGNIVKSMYERAKTDAMGVCAGIVGLQADEQIVAFPERCQPLLVEAKKIEMKFSFDPEKATSEPPPSPK